MMRVCHLDTCPVGVATQNPELRARFSGKPEFVVNFFEFIAEEVREYLAALGFRSLDEAIGRTDVLNVRRAVEHWKADGLDLEPILQGPKFEADEPRRHARAQDHELERHFDVELINLARGSLESGESTVINLTVRNTERAVGTMLGHELTKKHGAKGLPDGTIDITLRGAAGQSFGAFMPRGISLRLVGDANDYVGKGLSGGHIVVRPDERSTFAPEENVIAGNVIGYGATSGHLFVCGIVGERFFVRNSGATGVVEGVGDHALEYMTGGLALILGQTGRNLGAGMSGGVAYVIDLDLNDVNSDARASGELSLLGLDETDIQIVLDLLSRHVAETGSPLARRLLEAGDATWARFTKVLPRDYAAVLATRQAAVDSGVDPDGEATWLKILEVTGG
jgi:glutamate synthase (NADPH/NADH) large chain